MDRKAAAELLRKTRNGRGVLNYRTQTGRLAFGRWLLMGSVALGAMVPLGAMAQTAQPAQDSSAEATESADSGDAPDNSKEIVVTGTRLGVSGFTAPTPVTVIGSQRL